MKKLLSFSLIFFSLAFASIQDAKHAINTGDYLAAVISIQTLLETDSQNVELLYTLSRAKVLLGQSLNNEETQGLYRQAVDHARAANELAPDNVQTHIELAIALGRLSQDIGILESIGIGTEMKGVLDRALELGPNNADVYHLLAIWHTEAPWIAGGRSERVVPYFETSLSLNPNSIMVYVDFAESLIRLEQPEAALAQLDLAEKMTAKTALDSFDLARAASLRQALEN